MKNMKKIKKQILAVVLMLMVVVTSCVLMPANVEAANDKALIKASVKKVMTSIKKSDDKTVYKYVTSSDKSQVENIKKLRKQSAIAELQKSLPSYYSYITKNNKKISFKITKITVNGNKASVQMKVKHVNSKKLAQNMVNLMSSDLASDEVAAEINALDSVEKMTTYFIDYSEKLFARASSAVKSNKTKTETITISMKKVKGKWFITDENQDGFAKIINLLYADVVDSMSAVDTSKLDYSKINVDQLMAIVFAEMNLDTTDLSKYSFE